ncbi:Uncharacterised protein [Mycobacteroides abscessus subsp. abscessus]|nr:Uncharacterised protein [Mycobacteroides abscessus subsp. abscessus]
MTVALVLGGLHAWRSGGPDRPKPPLYGIWSVSQYTRDGQVVPPLTTDTTRWKTVVFDYPGTISFQRMNDTLATVPADVDAASHRIRLLPGAPKSRPMVRSEQGQYPLGTLDFQQTTSETVLLTGELDGHQVTMTLDRIDPDSFPQRSTPFRWVQNRPNF